jgi:hypothetical protein
LGGSFLDAQAIPRSTADLLVRNHEKALNTEGGNCGSGQISEPTDVTVRRYLHGLWPRLNRVLKTREAVEVFIGELKHLSENSFREAEGSPPGL